MQDSTKLATARVRTALQSAGLPSDAPVERASSTRNEVFLAGDYAIRFNLQPNHRLRREAQTCAALRAALPESHWVPSVIGTGGKVGADYMIVARRAGVPLSRAWPSLDDRLRRRAIGQLGQALRELHTVPSPAGLPRLPTSTHLIDARSVSPIVPLLIKLDELRRLPNADIGLLKAIQSFLMETGSCLDDYSPRTLIHGDLSFENILWDGNGITGILDFEWSQGASPDLDLDVLFRYCGFPHAHLPPELEATARAEDYLDVPLWMAEAYPDLVAHPHLADRLITYSLAFDVRDLAEHSETLSKHIGPLHPLRRLRSLMEDGGHLRPLLDRLGLHARV